MGTEFHYLDGSWYVYFAADDGDNVNHRMHVLEGGTDANNPLNGTYSYKGKITDSTDRWAIDGAPFVYNNTKYFVWSGDYPNFGTPIAVGVPMAEPSGSPSSSIPTGKTIWLKAKSNGNYVCADKDYTDTPLLARSGGVDLWEKFEVHDAGNGYVALKALSNNLYVTANKDLTSTPLQAKGTLIKEWEMFTWGE